MTPLPRPQEEETNNSNNNLDQGEEQNLLRPRVPRVVEEYYTPDVQERHPKNRVDHRPQGGPLLELLWCQPDNVDDNENDERTKKEQPLHGQTLYLGGEIGSDGKVYCIPGHADRVLTIDPLTDVVKQMGPRLSTSNGGTKFKWLRGIPVQNNDVIYGLPCHADAVLKIHVPTGTVTQLPIPYETFYAAEVAEANAKAAAAAAAAATGATGDNDGEQEEDAAIIARQQRRMIWKYHGGSISPLDGCIYAIPQSAWHVLKIDPRTDQCTFVGPRLTGKYKWYGGVAAACNSDGALYTVPQNATSVLRITPSAITLHGQWPAGGHKWHGAAMSGNGVMVCVPNNVNTVLCVIPGDPDPRLVEVGSPEIIQTGRHRSDGKYKYLGALAGPNGRVYVFPSGSEQVLEVDTSDVHNITCRNVGPNLRDAGMERIFQNKWQNGLTNHTDGCVYAIPLAGETVLRIDCSNAPSNGEHDGGEDGDDVKVTTWPLPSPYETLDKWEGGVLCPNGIMYAVPNNCKAVLKIQPCGWKPAVVDNKNDDDNEKEGVSEVSETPALPAKAGSSLKSTASSSVSMGDSPPSKSNSQPQAQAPPSNNGKSGNKKTTIPTMLASAALLASNPTAADALSPSSLPYTDRGSGDVSHTLDNPFGAAKSPNDKKKVASDRDRGDISQLVYKSGIPTLRSSAHRVKFDVKRRRHDPKPRDANGNETYTTWLPNELLQEDVFAYDLKKYDLAGALVDLLENADASIVGTFRPDRSIATMPRLEDFEVPVNSVWRSVNGGCCEDAQRYLSDQVASHQLFLETFDRFVSEMVLPYVKERLVDCGAISDVSSTTAFYYQRPPTLRLQPGPGWAKVKPHNDSEYGHQNGELNIWVPLTDRELTGVDLWCESEYNQDDYHPVVAQRGEAISFHGSSCRHYVNANASSNTRVSLDFRIGIQGYFDPTWAMQGTTDDHTRRRVEV